MSTSDLILDIKNLGMRFGGIVALNDTTFSVQRNSITALIGPNGAGKTTLFNCLTGFYTATSGNLLYTNNQKNINIRKVLGEPLTFHHWIHPHNFITTLYYKLLGGSHILARNGIARTFQNIRLFKEMSVVENLLVAQHMFANRNLVAGLFETKNFKRWEKQAIEQAYYWLDIFGLTDSANRLAGELSYGRQRHLEIARSMCTKPSLLCLDEPAAGLNPKETDLLSQQIQDLRQDHHVTVLLIEHDMSMVMSISDHIIVLDHGEIICQGDPKAVKEDKRVIAAYLGIEQDAA
tara:strand:- start:70542 stop:71417 length:876 start_codon:yes stop_codon:yes gene_type:complete